MKGKRTQGEDVEVVDGDTEGTEVLEDAADMVDVEEGYLRGTHGRAVTAGGQK